MAELGTATINVKVEIDEDSLKQLQIARWLVAELGWNLETVSASAIEAANAMVELAKGGTDA